MHISPIVYELEYRHLDLSEDEGNAIDRWVRTFIQARESGLLERCQQLLVGIKGTELSTRSQGLVLRCRALLEQIREQREHAIRDFQHSLELLLEAEDFLTAGRVCNDLGTLFQGQGNFASATQKYRKALEYWLPTWEGTAEEAMARNNLGVSLADSGFPDEAAHELEIAAKLFRALGYPQGEARVQINQGDQYRRAGKMDRAKEVYHAALDILRVFDDQHPMVDVFNSLGIVHRYLGDFGTAIDYYTQSLELAQQVRNLDGQAQALNNLGNIHLVQEKYEQAQYFYLETLQLYELLGDRSGRAKALGNLGQIQHVAYHDHQNALKYYHKELAIYQDITDAEGEAFALINIAGVFRHQKEYSNAEPLFQRALEIGKQQQNVRIQDFSLCALGTIRLNQKQWDESERYLQSALALQEQRQDQHAQVETRYKLGLLAYNRGEYDKVLGIIEPAWEMSFEQNYSKWLFNIAWLMGDTILEQKNVGAYNYYAAALVFAQYYDDEKRYRRGIDELTEKINEIKSDGHPKAAAQICEQILAQLQEEGIVGWSEAAIEHFSALLAHMSS